MTEEDKRDLGCVGIIVGVLTLLFVVATWNIFWDVLRDPSAYESRPIVKYIVVRPASDGQDRGARTQNDRVSTNPGLAKNMAAPALQSWDRARDRDRR